MGTAAPPNCPPGLEYLSLLDQLLIKQKVELLEAFTGFETNNKVFDMRNVWMTLLMMHDSCAKAVCSKNATDWPKDSTYSFYKFRHCCFNPARRNDLMKMLTAATAFLGLHC